MSESGILRNREQYSIASLWNRKQRNDSNIDDEIVETQSFTADGGGFECAVIASVLPVFVCFSMEND